MGEKLEIKKIYNLTPMQEGMLFHSLLEKHSNSYFEQTIFSINGKLDLEVFEKSFNKLIERYDVFRTNFVHEKVKNPQQVVFKKKNAKVHFEDIEYLTKEEKHIFVDEFKKKIEREALIYSRILLSGCRYLS